MFNMDEKITMLEKRISALENEIAELKKPNLELAYNMMKCCVDALSMQAWPEAWNCERPVRRPVWASPEKTITIYQDGTVEE